MANALAVYKQQFTNFVDVAAALQEVKNLICSPHDVLGYLKPISSTNQDGVGVEFVEFYKALTADQ